MKTLEDLRFMRATDRCWAAIREAQQLCRSRGHAKLMPLHLLHGLLHERAQTPIFDALLEAVGITKAQLRVFIDSKLDDVTASMSMVIGNKLPEIEFSQLTFEACEKAYEDANNTNRDVGTGTCNLLVGILHAFENTDPACAEWFAIKGVTSKTVSACHAWTLQHLPDAVALQLFFKNLSAINANPITIIVEKRDRDCRASVEGRATLASDWLTNEYAAIGDLLIRHGAKLGIRIEMPYRG